MKVIECSGSPRDIGHATGEALREEIRHNIEVACRPDPDWDKRLATFLGVMRRLLPDVLEELEATAAGANLPADDVYRLNFPLYADGLRVAQGCTNVAFAGGPDGPVLGKNNDGLHGDFNDRLWPCLRVVRPDRGIPLAMFTFCGMVITDGMNAEGLAVGHSSVGSVFQQSDTHAPIRPWMYQAMMQARSTSEYVERMIATPLRGKGYSILANDRGGVMRSLEAPCPIVQVRGPSHSNGMNCVNCYQLPALKDADRRAPEGKANAIDRQQFLEQAIETATSLDAEYMKQLLCHHGSPSICRHGESRSHTEYSMIFLPRDRRVLYVDGYACEHAYEELTI